MKSVREGLNNKRTCKQRPEGSERASPLGKWGTGVSDKEKAMCRCLLMVLRDTWEAHVSRVKGDKIREAGAEWC